jgi:transposase-like protein
LTIVEDVKDVSASSPRVATANGVKTRGSRRPKLSPEESREIARLYSDTNTSTSAICSQFGIGESSLYRIVQRQGIPLRGRSAASKAPGRKPAQSSTRGRRAASTARPRTARAASTQRGAPAGGSSTPASVGGGKRFRIRYFQERVFEAATIQEAVRQAESLGATEIMGVAREAS